MASNYYIRHADGRRDNRYSIQPEGTGEAPEPQYVARFCGDFLGSAPTEYRALLIASAHQNRRTGSALTITLSIEVSADVWATEFGLSPEEVKDDAASYFNEYMRGSNAFANGWIRDVKVQ